MPEILEIILKDVLSQKEVMNKLKSFTELELGFARYTLGAYIRNKYLWFKPENIEVLGEYYNEKYVDNISSKIIDDVLAIINKK